MPDINNMMRPPMGPKPTPPKKRSKWLLVAAVIVVLIVVAGWLIWGNGFWSNLSVGKGYQAVFLSNGQVYFGKLELGRSWVVLKDIYYLQVTQDLQPASNGGTAPTTGSTSDANNSSNKLQLVKLGSELHGPEDAMYVARDKVLFWENIKDDSQVMQAIKQAQSAKK
jgi:hypothetical protein